MAGAGRLEELELSAEETERLQRAFRDEQFRALFAEYAAELADPEQRRLYEEEVAALERERGVEVRFVHPTAGYVLRTSQAGSRRCYLNICSNPHVGLPQARPEPGGHRWALPYSLAPGREELGRGGHRRWVYDVVFHPAALRLAARSARFRRLLSDTALEAVERHGAVQLDRANATVLRGTKYKGVPQAPVIRTPLPGGAPPPPADSPPLPPFPFPPAAAPPPPPPTPAAARPCGPTTPRWSIRHRSYVDLQDYRCCRDSAPSLVPRELVVTVELPLLRSAAQAALEIRGRELRLDSQRPAYRLRLRLPYDVDENGGRASFDKAQRQLLVTLPVLPRPGPSGERLEEAEPGAEGLDEPPAVEAGGGTAPPLGPGGGEPGEPPAGRDPSPPRSGAVSPAPSASPEPAALGRDTPPCPPGSPAPPAAEGSPGEMAHPRGSGSPEAAVCPPFHCRQDEASLTLLLRVPGIQPQSLSGDVGTNHYSLRFSSATGTFALFLQFPPANRLAPPESSVSVAAHSAAIGLAKAPGSTGLWEKFCFGLDASALQERLFVSEENVDGFLGTVLCPSFCSQSALESQPLIEVLDVTEDRIQIRLKVRISLAGVHIAACFIYFSNILSNLTETPLSLFCLDIAGKNVEWGLFANVRETSVLACFYSSFVCPVHFSCKTIHLFSRQPQEAARSECDGKGEMLSSSGGDLAEKTNGNYPQTKAETNCTAADSVQGERATETKVNMQDGSVQVVRDHVTCCPVVFQSSLLYELD
uniref:Protein kintoun n=1 Tax=Strix occidentalis caurina TaxID=311401 RepID=A0A8D0KUZ7_STROC